MSRRPDPWLLAAVLLPVVAVVASLLATSPAPAPVADRPPEETALARSTVVCPPGGRDLVVASTAGASGSVDLRTPGGREQLEIEPGTATRTRVGGGAVVVTGLDDLAPGLVAARFASPLSSVVCSEPEADQWFTGLGAGARHRSTLQLVNPDGGQAIVDVTVLGRNGEVEAAELRGITVPGGSTFVVDLASELPRRDDLALRVQTLRGRVVAGVRDSFEEIGGDQGADALPAQDAPSTENLVLGVPEGSGQRTLVLANPGDEEGRSTIRLVTGRSVFTPEAGREVTVGAGSVRRVPLSRLLRGEDRGGDERPLGLLVQSTVGLTADLVSFVSGDLVHTAPSTPVDGDGGTVPLPGSGRATLVLGGAVSQDVVTVQLWDADGERLDDRREELGTERALAVRLPRKARLVRVVPRDGTVSTVVLVSDGDRGTTLVRPLQGPTTGLVPQVSPALP